ncbi:glutamic acid-rich protein [Salix suchowensis]|nr:glutamic acid-rich protein [Salix suchowensis]
MKSSQNLPTARAEKRRVFQDLAGEEEDVGLACPPFDEEGFMAAEASYFDLSEEGFFSRVHEDHHKSAERVQGSPGNLSAALVKKKRHGEGKDMKVIEDQLVSKRKNNACKDTNTTPDAKILFIEPKKTLAKAAIGDGLLSFEEKITLAKRKLHERYDQVAKEKRRKQIQVLSLSELCFTSKFKSCAGSH